MLPILMVLTLGVVDASRVFSAWVSLTNAVREGALYAISSNNATHWCARHGAIACPTNGGAVTDGEGQCSQTSPSLPIGIMCDDPDNIAYLVGLETTNLDQSRVTLLAPTCATATCDSASATSVTISATYQMNLIMPVISNFFGNPVTLSASATAPLIR